MFFLVVELTSEWVLLIRFGVPKVSSCVSLILYIVTFNVLLEFTVSMIRFHCVGDEMLKFALMECRLAG